MMINTGVGPRKDEDSTAQTIQPHSLNPIRQSVFTSIIITAFLSYLSRI
jgi:hypothetical protein